MLESALATALSFVMLVGVHLWDVDRLRTWQAEAVKLLTEWDDLHPGEQLRRSRKLLARYPEPLL